jgi:hypothetical protein
LCGDTECPWCGTAQGTLGDMPQQVPTSITVPCAACRGDGWIETGMNDVGIGNGHECRLCAGSGFVYTNKGAA